MNDANRNAIDSGEFIVDDVIREGSAARYSLALDRVTALETAIRQIVTATHKTYHVGMLHQHWDWERCKMSICRNARKILNEEWQRDE